MCACVCGAETELETFTNAASLSTTSTKKLDLKFSPPHAHPHPPPPLTHPRPSSFLFLFTCIVEAASTRMVCSSGLAHKHEKGRKAPGAAAPRTRPANGHRASSKTTQHAGDKRPCATFESAEANNILIHCAQKAQHHQPKIRESCNRAMVSSTRGSPRTSARRISTCRFTCRARQSPRKSRRRTGRLP